MVSVLDNEINLNSTFLYTENYDDDKRKKKRSKSVDRLDAMDEKLSDIRNLIIDDTARYLSHHDGKKKLI